MKVGCEEESGLRWASWIIKPAVRSMELKKKKSGP